MSRDLHTVEGIARVVGVDGATAWLEPEQTSSCGSCASASSCGAGAGAGGIGTVTDRIAARRFSLDNADDLHVGERVVVGVAERALIRAALTAYGLPLVTALTAGGIAESAWASDLATMAAMAAGLVVGLLAAGTVARRLAARGDLAPRFLRISSPFKGGEAGIRDACVAPPQPASCAKPAVGRAAAGRGMGEETGVPSTCHASLTHPLPNPPLEGEGASMTLSIGNSP
ncbi:SoxR reducing system RseC family protein [Sulfuritalea sp.]|uniref:SoxR reducing system RseC family protein n=1 Tax=Sulfuritalea sp. TaxID=2480090 RepID=UPI00286D6A41|nr:SoxR reducing system RseC family protein [Sulfuritalea sp.]